jgi:hypothetical protein
MERMWIACVALSFGAALAGCGGRQGLMPADDADAGATAGASIGPVDLTGAPPELAMTCDHGIGTLAFDNPCLVGMNLLGDLSKPGEHEIECHLAGPGHPIVWAFLVPLAQIAQHPDQPLTFPSSFPTSPTSGMRVDVGGHKAGVSSAAGTVTFSRVDPTGRAFIARFNGTITWKETTGSTFSCAVDAPFWGAPGGFL